MNSSAQCKTCVFIFCLSFFWGAQAEAWKEKVSSFESAVKQKLVEAQSENNPDDLAAIDHIFYSFCSDNDPDLRRNWSLYADKIERFRLEVLQTAYSLRDRTYDLTNPPAFSINVMPPAGGSSVGVVGMDPKGVSNPEARERYKRAMEENKRRLAKHEREVLLKRLCDEYLSSVRTTLSNAQQEGSVAVERYRSLIKMIIKDEALVKQIFSGMLEKEKVP